MAGILGREVKKVATGTIRYFWQKQNNK
jgi:hypothetical protein